MADVLIIETDSILLDLMQLSLAQRRLQVVCSQNGADALAAFLNHTPRLVLLDMFLPQTNVLDMIRRMKKRSPGTAILLLSSFGFPEVVQQALQAGAQDYLLKPVNMDVLAERVEKALNAQPPSVKEASLETKPLSPVNPGKEISKPIFPELRRRG